MGALLLGSTAGSAGDHGRFIVDRRKFRRPGDVTVVHDLEPVDLLVVEGDEAVLTDSRAEYAADTRLAAGGFEPVRHRRADAVSDSATAADSEDDRFAYQWDKQDQRIPEIHETTRGEGTRVGIIDSGIASGHPALEGRVDRDLSRSFAGDEFGIGEPYAGTHGTHVAGIVAATGETGVIGSAPEAELIDLRVFAADPGGDAAGDADATDRGRGELPPDLWSETYMGDVMAALVYAVEIDCDVVNLSLGWTWAMREEGWGRFWGTVMQRVGNYARSNGTVHAHACGNWGGSLQFNRDETDSSQIAGGLTVSATGPVGFDPETGTSDQPAYTPSTYTNHGVGAVDLAAPGGYGGEHRTDDVFNTTAVPEFDDDGSYVGADYGHGWLAGTSMAAPQVAGAAALVKSATPRYNANQVRNALHRGAERPDEYEHKYYGSGGYLDTYAAVEASRGGRR